MKTPGLPHDEQVRLGALRSLNVLDTEKEARFDRLTRLAARTFQVPIALISLVDANRQWFKSRVGLECRETSRDISFCGHAILGEDLLVIADTVVDRRFADNPLVVGEPYVRFYAGCPLRAGGAKLGTLCIIDRQPRALSDADRAALRDLAALAEHELAATQLDRLTHLLSRAGFVELSNHCLQLSVRDALPVSLVLLDLLASRQLRQAAAGDGAPIDDAVLREFADLLDQRSDDADLCAHFEGRRFALFLPKSRGSAEEAVAEFQRSLGQLKQSNGGHQPLSFAHCVVEFNRDRHRTVETMMIEADQLMQAQLSSQ